MRAAAAVGAEYAGVDLLPARDGTVYVLEVNGIPGWQGLQEATGIDVAGAHRRPARRTGRGDATPEEVAAAGQLACLLEVSAPKPGNVSPGRHFHDTRYEDFLASAVAIGPALAARRRAPARRHHPRGGRGHRRAGPGRTPTSASCCCWRRWRGRRLGRAATLRERLREVLAETTVADAAEVYAAIRRARPGGLGRAARRGRRRRADA